MNKLLARINYRGREGFVLLSPILVYLLKVCVSFAKPYDAPSLRPPHAISGEPVGGGEVLSTLASLTDKRNAVLPLTPCQIVSATILAKPRVPDPNHGCSPNNQSTSGDVPTTK